MRSKLEKNYDRLWSKVLSLEKCILEQCWKLLTDPSRACHSTPKISTMMNSRKHRNVLGKIINRRKMFLMISDVIFHCNILQYTANDNSPFLRKIFIRTLLNAALGSIKTMSFHFYRINLQIRNLYQRNRYVKCKAISYLNYFIVWIQVLSFQNILFLFVLTFVRSSFQMASQHPLYWIYEWLHLTSSKNLKRHILRLNFNLLFKSFITK